MKNSTSRSLNLLAAAGLLLASGAALSGEVAHEATPGCEAATAVRYIVQAKSASTAGERVLTAGGRVCRDLTEINSVGATLTDAQLKALRAQRDVRVFADRRVSTSVSQSKSLY